MSIVTAYHFWSPTCRPCKVIKPSIEMLKEDFPTVAWVTVNTHEDPEGFVRKLGVSVVPTIAVVSANGVVEKHTGTDMMGYYRILRNATKE
jgi:thioredoxin-like negative regulator of GroEL